MIKVLSRKKIEAPKDVLKKELLNLILQSSRNEELPNDYPTKWEKHGDLILLPASSFQNPIWLRFGTTIDYFAV